MTVLSVVIDIPNIVCTVPLAPFVITLNARSYTCDSGIGTKNVCTGTWERNIFYRSGR